MRIVFLTNLDCEHSALTVRRLVDSGETVAGVFASAYRPESKKGALELVKEYGLPFIMRKAAGMLAGKLRPPSAVREYERLKVPVHVVPDINGEESLKLLREAEPDILISSTFSQILSAEVIRIPKVCGINVHASLLPDYRGPAPVFWALYERAPKTGVTVHYLDTGIDTGNIIMQREIEIDPTDDIRSLEDKIAPLTADMIVDTVNLIKSGNAKGTPQPAKKKYYPRPKREDWKNFEKIMKSGRK